MHDSSPGVTPVKDQNAPSPAPDAEDPITSPDFLAQLYDRLAAVRSELSALWSEQYSVKFGRDSAAPPVGPYAGQTGSRMEADALYDQRKRKLEAQEAGLMAAIREFSVATLGDAP